jgi:hypothetical protein
MAEEEIEWLRVKIPKEGCDICGNTAKELDLVGGKKGRTWICLRCKKDTEIYLYTTPEGREMLRSIFARKKAKELSVEEADERHTAAESEQEKKSN